MSKRPWWKPPLISGDDFIDDSLDDVEVPMSDFRCKECHSTGDCPECNDLAVSNCSTCNGTGRCPHCNSDSTAVALR